MKQDNIDISTIYMPLVRTPMIAPTKIYNYAPTWSVDKASNWSWMRPSAPDQAHQDLPRADHGDELRGGSPSSTTACWPAVSSCSRRRPRRAAKGDEAPSGETMALAYLLRARTCNSAGLCRGGFGRLSAVHPGSHRRRCGKMRPAMRPRRFHSTIICIKPRDTP